MKINKEESHFTLQDGQTKTYLKVDSDDRICQKEPQIRREIHVILKRRLSCSNLLRDSFGLGPSYNFHNRDGRREVE